MWPVFLLGTALAAGQAAPAAGAAPAVSVTAPLLPAEPSKPGEPTAPAPSHVPAERWSLMQALQGTWYGALLDGNRLRVYGWTEASFTGGSAGHDNSPMGFNYRDNQLQVEQHYLRVERTVEPTALTPTFGFRSDTLIGTDYRYTVARGLFSGQLEPVNGRFRAYGFDPVQFYGEAYFPQVGRGLDLKLGRFFSQYGAESTDTTQNLFVSRSYCFIYDPFTHTGLLSTLRLTDAWTVQNGLVTGSDVFIHPAARPTYIGSIKWAPPSARDSILVSVILGPGRFEPERNFNNLQVFDVVYTHKFSDRLNYTADLLFGYQTNVPQIGTATWLGSAHYLAYQLTPRLAAVARLDFFDDFQGQRTGFRGLYTALTAGVNFKPRPWLWLRPEVRCDYNDESRPFEGRPALFTAAMDVVLRW